MSEDIRNVFISHIREDDASLAHLKSTVLSVSRSGAPCWGEMDASCRLVRGY